MRGEIKIYKSCKTACLLQLLDEFCRGPVSLVDFLLLRGDKTPDEALELLAQRQLLVTTDNSVVWNKEREREMFYLTTHSTHFIYGYMASDIWLRTILIVRKETCCCHIGYSYRLTARVLLYAPSHIQDNTYHSLCYTSRGVLAGTRNMFIQSYNVTTGDHSYYQHCNL